MKNNEKKCRNQTTRVLVCGTGFGKVYLNAISQIPEYSIAGILGKGSKRSRKIAEDFEVPFFTEPEDTKIDADCACVIVPNSAGGGNGCDIAKKLLKRNIAVLLEHPAHEKEIGECLKVSGSNAFMLNPFYRYISPVRQFMDAAEIIKKHSRLMNASLECAIHVLYDGLDMLCCSLKTASPWKLGGVADIPESKQVGQLPGGGNKTIGALIGGIPVTIKVNTQVDKCDPDHPLHLYHRLELTFSTGRLCLVNTNGPIVWLPFLRMPRGSDDSFELNTGIEALNIPSAKIIGQTEGSDMEQTFHTVLKDAVDVSLNKLMSQTAGEKIREAQFQIMVSRLWSEICQSIGYSQFVDYDKIEKVEEIYKELISNHI